jgi:Secretion system C-terminal sorting domain
VCNLWASTGGCGTAADRIVTNASNGLTDGTGGSTINSSSEFVLSRVLIVNIPSISNPTITCGPVPAIPLPSGSIAAPTAQAVLDALEQPELDIMDVQDASAIANNAQSYFEFVNSAQRLDERLLQDWLRNNPPVRAQYPILNTFYLENYQDDLDNLGKLDELLVLLTDSIIVDDSVAYDSLYDAASTINEEITSTEFFATEEVFMNSMYLKRLEGAQLSAEEVGHMHTLANTCPYIAGNATYKARAMMQLYGIARVYDDRTLCNSQGVYKTKPKSIISTSAEFAISMYPNPSSGLVNIGSTDATLDEAVQVLIYDASGRLVLRTAVQFTNGRTSTDISGLAAGTYTVKLNNENGNLLHRQLLQKW